MADFVLIKDCRIRKSCIKEYAPVNYKVLVVYFNTSRYKLDIESYSFESKEERDDTLAMLDFIFLSMR